ncbi:head-tail connector protein [Phenylobacterium sp.]|uniref:head-tail connector protein n=1 Tax=Phenylobacterium sp. TaxID=1871053 RepID=UPI0035AE52DF
MLDLELVTPPAASPLGLEEAKRHLRVDHADEDQEIEDAILAAVGHLDGAAGTLRRAIVDQTWRLWLDGFPPARGAIDLPLPPLLAVTEIRYLDAGGVEALLPPDAYRVLAGERAAVEPAITKTWPSALTARRAVSITYRCGWTAPAPGTPWPAKVEVIRRALRLLVGEFYEHRDSQAAVREPLAVTRLLRPIRIPRVG